MPRLIVLCFPVLMALTIVLFSSEASAKKTLSAEAQYSALVQKIKTSPAPEDFQKLRQLIVKTDRYKPYSTALMSLQGEMFKMMSKSDWDKCLKIVSEMLSKDFTALMAHLGGMGCSGEKGLPTEMKQSRKMLSGFLDAIQSTGDGRAPATAYKTMSVNELKSFLHVMGYQVISQSLVSDKILGSFDRMTVINRRTQVKEDIYFDINLQMSAMKLPTHK